MRRHHIIYIYGTLYNNINRIQECIKSISGLAPYKLFVVDNHSDDGSYEYLLGLKKGYMKSINSEIHVFRGKYTRGKARDIALKKLFDIGRPKDKDIVLYIDFDVIYKRPFINLVSRESEHPTDGIGIFCIGMASIAQLNKHGWCNLHVGEDYERLARLKSMGVPIRKISREEFSKYAENDKAEGDEHRYVSGLRYYIRIYKNLIDNERGLAFKSFKAFYSQRKRKSTIEAPIWLSAYIIAKLMGVYSYNEKLDNRSYVEENAPDKIDLNTLFESRNEQDILRFYDYFPDRQSLINWMRRRQSGKIWVSPQPPSLNVASPAVAVVPTYNINSKYARNIRSLFDGIPIVFIENDHKNFNFGKTVNLGINYAMKHYNTSWLIISNDDMIRKDGIGKLFNNLKDFDNKRYDCLFSSSLENKVALFTERWPLHLLYFLRYLNPNQRHLRTIIHKFGIKYFALVPKSHRLLYNLIFKQVGKQFSCAGDFFILSTEYAKKQHGKIYDEVFQNDFQDIWLSISFKRHRTSEIDFNIGRIGSVYYGISNARMYHGIAGTAYLNELLESRNIKNA